MKRLTRLPALCLGFLCLLPLPLRAQAEAADPGRQIWLILKGEGKRPEGMDFPLAYLKLPPERADRLKMLQVKIDSRAGALKRQLQEASEELEQAYGDYHVDEKRCLSLFQVIRNAEDEMLKLHHVFQLELRKILSPTEFAQLQAALRAAREKKKLRMLQEKLRSGDPGDEKRMLQEKLRSNRYGDEKR